MSQLHIHTSELKEAIPQLKAGDRLLLSGTVYTSLDAAHKRIFSLLDEGKPLPYPLVPSFTMPVPRLHKRAWQLAPAALPPPPGWTPMPPGCWIWASPP